MNDVQLERDLRILKKKGKINPTTIALDASINPCRILSELMETYGDDKEEKKQKEAKDNNKVQHQGNKIIDNKKNKYNISNQDVNRVKIKHIERMQSKR